MAEQKYMGKKQPQVESVETTMAIQILELTPGGQPPEGQTPGAAKMPTEKALDTAEDTPETSSIQTVEGRGAEQEMMALKSQQEKPDAKASPSIHTIREANRNPRYINATMDDRVDYLHFQDGPLHIVTQHKVPDNEKTVTNEQKEQIQPSHDDASSLTIPKELINDNKTSTNGRYTRIPIGTNTHGEAATKKQREQIQPSHDDVSSLTFPKELINENQTSTDGRYTRIPIGTNTSSTRARDIPIKNKPMTEASDTASSNTQLVVMEERDDRLPNQAEAMDHTEVNRGHIPFEVNAVIVKASLNKNSSQNNINSGDSSDGAQDDTTVDTEYKNSEADIDCDDTAVDNEYDYPVVNTDFADTAPDIYEEIPNSHFRQAVSTDPTGQLGSSAADPETGAIVNTVPPQAGHIEHQHIGADIINDNLQQNPREGNNYQKLQFGRRFCRLTYQQRRILKYVGTMTTITVLFATILYLSLINFSSSADPGTLTTTEEPTLTTTEESNLTTTEESILTIGGEYEGKKLAVTFTFPGGEVDMREYLGQRTVTNNEGIETQTREVYLIAYVIREHGKNMSLLGTPYSIGIPEAGSLKARSRNFILDIPEKTILHAGSSSRNSWFIFSVSGAVEPLVAFTVTRTTPWTTPGHVSFDTTLLNVGGGYKPADREFIANRSGIYYFTISAGVPAEEGATLQLRQNGQGVIEVLHNDTNHTGTTMMSSAVLVSLTQGDRVHVELVSGSLHSSVEYNEVSWSGFLYKPKHGHSYAWSVWRNSSWIGRYLVPYDVIQVNEGGLYNTSSHKVTIPVSGVYYIHIVVGTIPGNVVGMTIPVGKSIGQSAIVHNGVGDNGVCTVSVGFLLSCEVGDTVWVTTFHSFLDESDLDVGDVHIYSNQNLVSGFSGFLVYTT